MWLLTFNVVLGYQGLPFRDFLRFFLGFFFNPTDRPTQYQEMHSTVNKEKKGDGLKVFLCILKKIETQESFIFLLFTRKLNTVIFITGDEALSPSKYDKTFNIW